MVRTWYSTCVPYHGTYQGRTYVGTYVTHVHVHISSRFSFLRHVYVWDNVIFAHGSMVPYGSIIWKTDVLPWEYIVRTVHVYVLRTRVPLALEIMLFVHV